MVQLLFDESPVNPIYHPNLEDPKSNISTPSDGSNWSLESLVILHRHGHRTPLRLRLPGIEPDLSCYVCNHKPGSCTFGQLTDRGKIAMFQLGSWIGQRYSSFMTQLDPHRDVLVYSTNYERTIDSAVWLLHGMFPNNLVTGINGNRVSSFLMDSPLVRGATMKLFNFVVKPKEEFLFPNAGLKPCERLRELKRELKHIFYSPNFKVMNNDFYSLRVNLRSSRSNLLEKYSSLFSLMPPDKKSIHGLFDALYCRDKHGLTLPVSANEKCIEELGNHSSVEWFTPYLESQEVIRLGIGRIIHEVQEKLLGPIRNSSPNKKLTILSAHDSTIGPFLATFGNFDGKWPPFCSNVIFELYRAKEAANEKFFVRVSYNGVPQIIPDCEAASYHSSDPTFCELEGFKKRCQGLIPLNYEDECKRINNSPKKPSKNKEEAIQ